MGTVPSKAMPYSAEVASALKSHSLIRRMKCDPFNREQIRIVLCQWYHPLQFFPTFLARHIALSQTMAAKTFVSRILWQELGEGLPERSHEAVYIETMSTIGFSPPEFVAIEPLPATRRLVNEYRDKSAADSDFLTSLGYLFATEDADLAMVSSIGSAVRRFSGASVLPWVDIHVRQEPDHTESVESTLARGLSAEQLTVVAEGASRMFHLWHDFFSDLEQAIRGVSQPLQACG